LIPISEIKKILLGALATLIIGIIVQLWKYRRDAYASRVDEFCKIIFDAADLGAEYWMTKRTSRVETSEREKTLLTETKLDGFQRKISLFAAMLRVQIRVADKDRMSFLIADFFDALTGANFGADARATNPARARLVYATGSDLIAHLRATTPQPSWLSILLGLVATMTILLLLLNPS
jgi:hypothetical protein